MNKSNDDMKSKHQNQNINIQFNCQITDSDSADDDDQIIWTARKSKQSTTK